MDCPRYREGAKSSGWHQAGEETEKESERNASEAPTAPLTTSTYLRERQNRWLLEGYSSASRNPHHPVESSEDVLTWEGLRRRRMKAWYRKDGMGSRAAEELASITRKYDMTQTLFNGDSRS